MARLARINTGYAATGRNGPGESEINLCLARSGCTRGHRPNADHILYPSL